MYDDPFDDRDDGDSLPPPALYRLELDGEWGLLEFSGFGRQYVQSYALYHLLIAAERGDETSWHELRWALNAFPWRGGWSSVDFFDALVRIVPRTHLPRIRRIRYSSPGFIEITVGLILGAHALKAVIGTYDKLHDAYRKTQKAAKENKLLGIDVRRAELSLRQEELAAELAEELRDGLGMRQFEALLRSTDVKPLAELKIFLALCRRIRPLSNLQNDDSIRF